MLVSILRKILPEKNGNKTVEYLIEHSRPNIDFFLMVILAVLMATLGLLLNNSAVIIGSMLIAPLLWPILGISMGLIVMNRDLIIRSVVTVSKALIFSILASALCTMFFSKPYMALTPEIISRTEPSLIYAVIAIIAGLAGSYTLIKPNLNETLPGVAISVALIPPIANIGIGLALLNKYIMWQSFLMFAINSLGIILASIFVFFVNNFYAQKIVIKQALRKDNIEEE